MCSSDLIGVLAASTITFKGSGVVFVDQDNRLLVLTANHLFHDCVIGNTKVFIGTETHWVATGWEPVRPELLLVSQGSQHQNKLRYAEQHDWCFLIFQHQIPPVGVNGVATHYHPEPPGDPIPGNWSDLLASSVVERFEFRPLKTHPRVYPHHEQFVRLLGYPGNYSLSSSCGRVVQPNANGRIIVDTYSDRGSSGGPLVCSEGLLLGVLSSSYASQRYARVEPVLPALQAAETMLAKFASFTLGSCQSE